VTNSAMFPHRFRCYSSLVKNAIVHINSAYTECLYITCHYRRRKSKICHTTVVVGTNFRYCTVNVADRMSQDSQRPNHPLFISALRVCASLLPASGAEMTSPQQQVPVVLTNQARSC